MKRKIQRIAVAPRDSAVYRGTIALYEKKGTPIPISTVAACMTGRRAGGSTIQWAVRNIARLRKFCEEKEYGFLESIRGTANRGRVTHLILCTTKQEAIATRNLWNRKRRADGFLKSLRRGSQIAIEEKIIPAEVVRAIERGEKPALLTETREAHV